MTDEIGPDKMSRLIDLVQIDPYTRGIACKECGVLLWDIEKHYRRTHPVRYRSVMGDP